MTAFEFHSWLGFEMPAADVIFEFQVPFAGVAAFRAQILSLVGVGFDVGEGHEAHLVWFSAYRAFERIFGVARVGYNLRILLENNKQITIGKLLF